MGEILRIREGSIAQDNIPKLAKRPCVYSDHFLPIVKNSDVILLMNIVTTRCYFIKDTGKLTKLMRSLRMRGMFCGIMPRTQPLQWRKSVVR